MDNESIPITKGIYRDPASKGAKSTINYILI